MTESSEAPRPESPPAPRPRRSPRVFILLALLGGVAVVGAIVLPSRYRGLSGRLFPVFTLGKSEQARFRDLEQDRARQAAEPSVADAAAPATLSDEEAAEGLLTGPAWPRYRGRAGDGRAEETGLLEAWPPGGPPELYRQPIGGGYAGFVIGNGRAFTIEQRREGEAVTAYDFATGRELWAYQNDARFAEPLGGPGPRATPTLDGGRVYALGALGDLVCLGAATGREIWTRDILGEFGQNGLQYGVASSPLVYEDLLLVTTNGGNGPGVLAFDKLTGETRWEGRQESQAYTTLLDATLLGRRQILNIAAARLNALDPATGENLWSFPWTTDMGLNNAQPIVIGADRVFLSSGYGQGAALVRIRPTGGGGLRPEQLWTSRQMRNKLSSSVYHEGYIYGLDEAYLVCLDAETGRRQWKAGRAGRYGYGQLIFADGKIIVLGEGGDLALVRATPDRFEEISKFQAIKGKSWCNLALAGGRLLIRNSDEMACFDLRRP